MPEVRKKKAPKSLNGGSPLVISGLFTLLVTDACLSLTKRAENFLIFDDKEA